MRSPLGRGFAVLAALSGVAARTDLQGCTSFTSTVTVRPEPGYGNTYESIVWYVPDTLEICAGVDCGGGRAPPKSVPGCPLYQGTETVTPKFLATDPAQPSPKSTSSADGATQTPGTSPTGTGTDTATTSSPPTAPAGTTTGASTPTTSLTSTRSSAAAPTGSAANYAMRALVGVAAGIAVAV